MRIIGFNIKKITAEKKENPKGKLEIKQGLNIDNISEEELSLGDNKKSLKFDFTFKVDYSPVGLIELTGSVLMMDEKDEGKEILKDWKKKKFDHAIKMSLFNFIMDKCNLKALSLEEEIGLPFHIPFPKLAPAQNKSSDSKNNNPANYAG